MSTAAHFWALFTLIAAGAQMLRNAAQHDLTARIGATGATFVRFLFACPFALAFLAFVCVATGETPPLPALTTLGHVVVAAAMQVFATGLMLLAMREKSFVVVTALTKTEALQIVLFGLLFLGDRPNAPLWAAVGCATIGVLALSAPTVSLYGDVGGRSAWRAVGYGLVSAAAFAVATVLFRRAILEARGASFVLAAAEILALGLTAQTLTILAWLVAADRPTMFAIAREWRGSLGAGALGAVATLFWFFAFALNTAARVRTLGLSEVLFAQVAARRLFAQRLRRIEWVGVGLLVIGVALALSDDP